MISPYFKSCRCRCLLLYVCVRKMICHICKMIENPKLKLNIFRILLVMVHFVAEVVSFYFWSCFSMKFKLFFYKRCGCYSMWYTIPNIYKKPKPWPQVSRFVKSCGFWPFRKCPKMRSFLSLRLLSLRKYLHGIVKIVSFVFQYKCIYTSERLSSLSSACLSLIASLFNPVHPLVVSSSYPYLSDICLSIPVATISYGQLALI